jgi:phosphoglucomutase
MNYCINTSIKDYLACKAHSEMPLKLVVQSTSGSSLIKKLQNQGCEIVKQLNVDLQQTENRKKDYSTINFLMMNDAILEAKNLNANLVISTDIHHTKIGVAVKLTNENKFKILTPNQIGLLLLDFLTGFLGNAEDNPQAALIRGINTSDLLERVAEKRNLQSYLSLAGQENLIEAIKFNRKNNEIFLALDEQNHFIINSNQNSSSPIDIILILCDIAQELQKEGKSLFDRVVELYAVYGLYLEKNFSVSAKDGRGESKLPDIMSVFRKPNYRKIGDHEIRLKNDYGKQISENRLTGKKIKLDFPKKDETIQFVTTDGCKIGVSAVKEDCKINYHISVNTRLLSIDEYEFMNNSLNEKVNKLMNQLIKA